MANLNDLINLAKADGGKFFVIDEQGNPSLVIMGVEDYEKILLGRIGQQAEEVEEINREILNAQIEDPLVSPPPSVIEAVISPTDLRDEVIDTSFDFEGPKVEIDDL